LYYQAFVSIPVTKDMRIKYHASLLPQGEEEDEGGVKRGCEGIRVAVTHVPLSGF
jgi:hypothetical protein